MIEFLSGNIRSSTGGHIVARVTNSTIICHQIKTEDVGTQDIIISSQNIEEGRNPVEVDATHNVGIASQSTASGWVSDGDATYHGEHTEQSSRSSGVNNRLRIFSRKWAMVAFCSGTVLKSSMLSMT